MQSLLFLLITCLSLNIKFAVTCLDTGIPVTLPAFILNFIPLCFLFSILIFFEGQLLLWSTLFLNFIISLIAFGDVEYFVFFNHYIPVCSYCHVKELLDSLGSLKKVFDFHYLLYFSDLPILAFIFFRFRQRHHRTISFSTRKMWLLIITWIVTTLLVASQFYMLKSFPVSQRKDSDIIRKYGVISYHILDFINYIQAKNRMGMDVPEHDLNLVKKVLQEKRNLYQSRRDELFGIAQGKNVIIVLLESFENFNLNTKVNGREISPNLNRLLQESIYFNNLFTQIGPGSTSDSEFTVNTSLYPLASGIVFSDYFENDFYFLPKILKEAGYHTYAFHANRGSFWNRAQMYENQGIDRFYSAKDFQIGEIIEMGLSDKYFFRQSLERIKNEVREPFYGLFVTLSSHHPFKLPPHLDQKLDWGKKIESPFLRDYLTIIRYEDEAIAEFLEGLRKLDLLDDSLVVLYGDHHIYLTLSSRELTSQLGIPYHQIEKSKVPLIIRLPGGKFARTVTYPCGQVDIMPTILYLLGVENPEIILGTNALLHRPDIVALSRFFQPDGSFVSEKHVFQNTRRKFKNGECYALPDFKPVDGKECLPEYNKVAEMEEISDIIIRGNIGPKKLKQFSDQ